MTARWKVLEKQQIRQGWRDLPYLQLCLDSSQEAGGEPDTVLGWTCLGTMHPGCPRAVLWLRDRPPRPRTFEDAAFFAQGSEDG